jgi:hypothetical protein
LRFWRTGSWVIRKLDAIVTPLLIHALEGRTEARSLQHKYSSYENETMIAISGLIRIATCKWDGKHAVIPSTGTTRWYLLQIVLLIDILRPPAGVR